MTLTDTQKQKIRAEEEYRAQVIASVSPAAKQTYGLPALLSFFIIGLGQIVKGDVLKGILFMLVGIVCFVMSFALIGIPFYIILWLWNIHDAYNSNNNLKIEIE